MNFEQAARQLAHTFQNGKRSEIETINMARDYLKQQLGTIEIHCQGCGTVHNVPKTWEIPKGADHLGCNWCPTCEANAKNYYQEWIVMAGNRRTKRESDFLKRRFPKQITIEFKSDA